MTIHYDGPERITSVDDTWSSSSEIHARRAAAERQQLITALDGLDVNQLGQLRQRAVAMSTTRTLLDRMQQSPTAARHRLRQQQPTSDPGRHQQQPDPRERPPSSGTTERAPGRGRHRQEQRSLGRSVGHLAGEAVNTVQRLASRVSRWWSKPEPSRSTRSAEATHSAYMATRQDAALNNALRAQGVSSVALATTANLAALATTHPDQQIRQAAEQQVLDRLYLQRIYNQLETTPLPQEQRPDRTAQRSAPQHQTQGPTGPLEPAQQQPENPEALQRQPHTVTPTQQQPQALEAMQQAQTGPTDQPAAASGSLPHTRLLVGIDHLQDRPADTFPLPQVDGPDEPAPDQPPPRKPPKVAAAWVNDPALLPANRATTHNPTPQPTNKPPTSHQNPTTKSTPHPNQGRH